jgi:hypothetical protein
MRLKWKLDLASFEIVLILTQDRCTVWAEHTRGSKIILYIPDGATRLDGSCGILFCSVWRQCYYRGKIGARFAPNIPLAQKSFWMHPMELLGDELQVEAQFSLFGDSANLDTR